LTEFSFIKLVEHFVSWIDELSTRKVAFTHFGNIHSKGGDLINVSSFSFFEQSTDIV
jgi:hypothetical protein